MEFKETGSGEQETGNTPLPSSLTSVSSSLLPSSLPAKRTLFWGCFAGMLVIDQLVKAWVRAHLNLHGTLNFPWTGVLELRFEYNTGIAYGQFEGKGVFLTPVAIAIAAGSAWYVYKHPKESRWNHAAFGLLASGALGNLYDRLFNGGKVTDMFWIRVFDFPIFNVADSCITVATVMLMIGWWREAAVKEEAKIPTTESTGTLS